MKTEERKKADFLRLATKRLNKAVKTVRLIGNLSNKHNYRYDEKDVDRIFSVLDKELRISKMKFSVMSKRDEEIKL